MLFFDLNTRNTNSVSYFKEDQGEMGEENTFWIIFGQYP